MKPVLAYAACTAGVVATTAAVGTPPPVDLTPRHVNFGNQPFESNTKRDFTVTNQSNDVLLVSIDQVIVGDDFSPGQVESTCPLIDPTPLQPGESCTHVIGFRPSEFFGGHEVALMRVVVRNANGVLVYTRDVRLSGRGF